jgi:hypothetical protein
MHPVHRKCPLSTSQMPLLVQPRGKFLVQTHPSMTGGDPRSTLPTLSNTGKASPLKEKRGTTNDIVEETQLQLFITWKWRPKSTTRNMRRFCFNQATSARRRPLACFEVVVILNACQATIQHQKTSLRDCHCAAPGTVDDHPKSYDNERHHGSDWLLRFLAAAQRAESISDMLADIMPTITSCVRYSSL